MAPQRKLVNAFVVQRLSSRIPDTLPPAAPDAPAGGGPGARSAAPAVMNHIAGPVTVASAAVAGEGVDQLIDYAGSGRLISRMQVLLRVDPGGVRAMDRNSTNDSAITVPGCVRMPLTQRHPALAALGSTVNLGARHFVGGRA